MPMFTLVLAPKCNDNNVTCASEFCAIYGHSTYDFAGIGARTKAGAIRRARNIVDAPAQGWYVQSIREV